MYQMEWIYCKVLAVVCGKFGPFDARSRISTFGLHTYTSTYTYTHDFPPKLTQKFLPFKLSTVPLDYTVSFR